MLESSKLTENKLAKLAERHSLAAVGLYWLICRIAYERLTATFSGHELKELAIANAISTNALRGMMAVGLMELSHDGNLFFIEIARAFNRNNAGRPSFGKVAKALTANANISIEAVNSLEVRKVKFIQHVQTVWQGEEAQKFIDYWTESGGLKMRFEKEKTFEVIKRIARWQNNQRNFEQVVERRISSGNIKNFEQNS